MLKKALALSSLTRFREYAASVTAVTLLGAKIGGGQLDLSLVLVLIANLASVAFAFMINDIEDAADDAQDERKSKRNPVSAGRISYRLALLATVLVCLGSLVLYALSSLPALILGSFGLLLSWLYSWQKVRLKTHAPWDVLSHSLLFGGMQFAAAYAAFSLDIIRLLPLFAAVLSISIYGELWNEMRDFESDAKVGLRHTAARLGKTKTTLLMNSLLLSALAFFAVSTWQGLLPLWLVAICVVAGGFYLALSLLIKRRHPIAAERLNLFSIYAAAALISLWFFVS